MRNKTSKQVVPITYALEKRFFVEANTFEGFWVSRVKIFEDSLACMSFFKICREENWREDQTNTAYGK